MYSLFLYFFITKKFKIIGQVDFEAISIFNNNKVPAVCYVALIATSKLHGEFSTSPYDFLPHAVKDIKISFGGNSYPDSSGIKVQYGGADSDWLEGYTSLLHREYLANSSIYQTYASFVTGHALYSFLLSNIGSLTFDHRNRTKSAEGRLNITFEAGNDNPNLTCILFTLTDSTAEIDASRIVQKGFIS